MPLVPIVQEIGLRGLPIDMPAREAMLTNLTERLALIDLSLLRWGIDRPNSTRALGHKLRELGVPLTQMTEKKTQFKLDAEILGEKHWRHNTRRIAAGREPRFPFLPEVLQRAKLAKAKENVTSLGVCHDGLLRTSLKACHGKTARYTSSGFGRKNKPGWCPVCREFGEHGTNLQNISRGCSLCGSSPRNCECAGGGIHIKSLFTAAPGWRLGEWDYGALELRIMAYRIRCNKLIERLERGDDLHTLHAQLMFPTQEITKRRRTLAKNFIYSLRGGGGDRSIQIMMAKAGEYVELSEIAEWRRAIFAEYPEIPAWIEDTQRHLDTQESASERRTLRNAFGRPRVFLGYDPLKEALAFEVSSTAADIMNFVALRLAYEQPDIMERVAMQVHDSFIIHAPQREFAGVMARVEEEMQRAVWGWERFMTYPTEGKAGMRWSELGAWPS